MIIELAALSVLVGLLRRGDLRGLGRIPLRRYYLFIMPLVLFGGIYALAAVIGRSQAAAFSGLAHTLKYALLIAALAANLHIPELRAIGLGVFMNFLACAVNGGVMPVSPRAAELAGLTQLLRPGPGSEMLRHSLMTPETRLGFLADIIPLPGFAFHTPEVASVGDLLIAVAVFVLIQRYMVGRAPRTEMVTVGD